MMGNAESQMRKRTNLFSQNNHDNLETAGQLKFISTYARQSAYLKFTRCFCYYMTSKVEVVAFAFIQAPALDSAAGKAFMQLG